MTMVADLVDYTVPATAEQVAQTAAAVQARGINVEIVETAADALAKIEELIPAGAQMMTASSKSLQDIGLEAKLVSKDHPWVNLKDEILAEPDPAVQQELRVKSTIAPYFLGSVQAITEAGEIVIGSASGSQLPGYAFSSQHVIWVAGIQKIVPTLNEALRRLREYNLPMETARLRPLYGMDSTLAKTLIIEQELPAVGRSVTLILVNEPVGV